jgi:hypothetical protein
LSLEQKTLWYKGYFEARLNLFSQAILYLDDPCMQVIFSKDVYLLAVFFQHFTSAGGQHLI